MIDMLMNGKKADMIFTDPPYSSGGFQEAGKASGSIGTRSQKRIANDNLSTRGYKNLINNVLSINRVDTIFMFCDWRMWIENFDLCENNSYRVRNMIVWNKNRMGMGRPFRSQHELVIFGSSENIKYKKCNQANVLTVERCRNELHETQKPIELLIKVLDNMEINISKRVYDPFLGSGTTLIACEKTNRKCSGMELDPHYCDVIVKRWEEFTGKKAKRVERVEG
jgi:DNA modification methylase